MATVFLKNLNVKSVLKIKKDFQRSPFKWWVWWDSNPTV